MSRIEVRLLTCDGVDDGEVCDAEYGGDTTEESETRSWARLAEDARTLAGWVSVGDRDYCPDHKVDAAAQRLRSLIAPSRQDGGVR